MFQKDLTEELARALRDALEREDKLDAAARGHSFMKSAVFWVGSSLVLLKLVTNFLGSVVEELDAADEAGALPDTGSDA